VVIRAPLYGTDSGGIEVITFDAGPDGTFNRRVRLSDEVCAISRGYPGQALVLFADQADQREDLEIFARAGYTVTAAVAAPPAAGSGPMVRRQSAVTMAAVTAGVLGLIALWFASTVRRPRGNRSC